VKTSLERRCVAECLGTALLLTAVVGSGIMAARLSGGNAALALLCNTLPTGAILTVLILTFGPLSGAHFNPVVSIAFALRRELPVADAAVYVGARLAGAVIGVWIAHRMFELPLWQMSATPRTGAGQWLSEVIANFGLLLTIIGCLARTPAAVPFAVGLYITSAYWFTAFHLLRESCGDARPINFRYLCRYRARRRHRLRLRTTPRHACSHYARALALAFLTGSSGRLRRR
jgi:glycerol uptake facilitator-like aquaporin